MKAIILAAGVGSRISKFIDEKPKSMVDIGGVPLIRYTVEMLRAKGIEDVTIVVGYRAGVIMEELKDERIHFVYNPFFDVTNGIASMWFAREHLTEGEDTILMSGDVYLEPEIVDELIALDKSPVLLADSARRVEADYRYHYENGILKRFGKDLTVEETTGECLGVAKLAGDFVGTYKAHMIEMINRQCHSVWWENVLYDLSKDMDIYVHDVEGAFWAEVDFIEDCRRIRKHRREKGL